jgi:hypothetical protein
MQHAGLRIEVQHPSGDQPATVTVTDTTVAANQWACHCVLRGAARVEFSVNADGLERVSFIPHASK